MPGFLFTSFCPHKGILAKGGKYYSLRGKKAVAFLREKAAKQQASKNLDKCKRKVLYISKKNNGEIRVCGSSGEFIACEDFLEKDENIVSYETQVYYKYEDREHSLDFLVFYKDGTKKAVEFKPKKRLTEARNIIQLYDSECHALSQGWQFEIWTEEQINIKKWKEATARADAYKKENWQIDHAASIKYIYK